MQDQKGMTPEVAETTAQVTPQISQEVIKLYDEYTHAPLERRVFIKRLTTIAGSTAAAYAMLPLLENNYANAQTVEASDARLTTERVTFASDAGPIKAYLAYPKSATGKLPTVIVIHENRGLNAHIEDVARRVALAGYVALAPDYLSPLGGTVSDEDKARDMFSKLEAKTAIATSAGATTFLKTHAKSTGKVGVVGFCWGGGQVNQALVNVPGVNAGVVYYGATPKPEDAAKVSAPLLVHLGGLDERINAMWPPYEQALKAANKSVTVHTYEGANHAFNNDTNAARYDAAAAKLAWQRTLDFFAKHLA